MSNRPRYRWKPLRRAVAKPPSEQLIAEWMRELQCSREEAIRIMDAEDARTELWINDLYQVQVRHLDDLMVHLNVRRRDGGPILRDWRHFQQIKNELVGPECEAIELYPAESRLVDTSNKYHLYAVKDPTFRFPVGFTERQVSYESGQTPGTRQRPL